MSRKHKSLALSNLLHGFVVISCLSAFTVSDVLVRGSASVLLQASQTSDERAAKQSDLAVRQLELGKPVETQLAGGQIHYYQAALKKDQYMRIMVDQRGLNILLKVFGPDNQEVAEATEPHSTDGSESLSIIAETAGVYS